MTIHFSYHKGQVLQALRYHFIARAEIRIMIVVVNVFALTSAALYYFKKADRGFGPFIDSFSIC